MDWGRVKLDGDGIEKKKVPIPSGGKESGRDGIGMEHSRAG